MIFFTHTNDVYYGARCLKVITCFWVN